MRFNLQGLIIVFCGLALLYVTPARAAFGDDWIMTPHGAFDKDGHPMDTAAMNHVAGDAFSKVKGEVDKALATIRTCKALQPELLANLEKTEKAFSAYMAAMQSLYYPTAESKSGTIYAQQSNGLNTRMLKQYLELLTPVFKGDQRAEWCGKLE